MGETKTSEGFEEIEEDELFSDYSNKEHPIVLYDFGSCSESDIQT